MFVIHSPHFLPPIGHRARRLAWAFLLAAPFAIGLLALALGQDINWDLRNYHYYNAYAFLNDRYDRDLLPSQTPFFYNPLLDVPFFLLATHASARLAGFALGFVQGFNVVLLFLIAHAALIVPNARHKVVICAALATLGMLGGEGISLIGTTFGDNIVSLGILLSAALAVRHLDRLGIDRAGRAAGLAFLFGIPAGLAVGLKLPTAIYAIGLCAGFLFTGGLWRRRFLLCVAFGLGLGAGAATAYGPWGWFLQTHFSSPLFPYFNEIFKSPYAPPDAGRDLDHVARTWHDRLLMPFLFAFNPWHVGEIFWRDWRVTVLYALLPLAIILRLFFGRSRAPADALTPPYAARYLLASFVIAYALWLKMFGIYRYAVALEMITPLLIVFAVGMLPLKIATRGLVAAFILAAISASIIPGDWGRRAEWLDRFVEATVPPLGDASNLMILMAGKEPYSHLIPEFPPQAAFVRIQSNFSQPSWKMGINDMIRTRIDAHEKTGGRFMLLIPPEGLTASEGPLRAFGLALAAQPCQTVIDKLYNDRLMSLCPVTVTRAK